MPGAIASIAYMRASSQAWGTVDGSAKCVSRSRIKLDDLPAEAL